MIKKMKKYFLLFLLFLLFFIFSLLLLCLQPNLVYALEVIFNDGNPNLDIRLYPFPEDDYFLLEDIVKIFPECTYKYEGLRQITVKTPDIIFHLTIGNSYVIYGSKSYKLYATPRLISGMILVPWEFINKLLAPALEKQIVWNWHFPVD